MSNTFVINKKQKMSNLLLKYVNNKPLNNILLLRNCRYLSGKVAVKESPQQEEQNTNQNALEKSEKLSQIHAKKTIKKPQRAPFIKNVFLGKFDTEMLTYPEALDKDGVERLDCEVKSAKFYYDNTEGSDVTRQEFLEAAKQLKLFGLQAGQLDGGRELNITETCKFNEMIARKTSDVQILNSEQMGVQALLKFGCKKQIGKYIEGIVNGNITMGLCVAEEKGCDPQDFEANATFDSNKKHWVLNGRKMYVVNGGSADVFVVFAKSTVFTAGMTHRSISAFLVERTFGGVTSTPYHTLGLKKSDIALVQFDNTHVPEENLLGEENKGLDIYSTILPEINLMNATACVTISRLALNKFVDHCKEIHTTENNLVETELVSEKIMTFSSNLYAMESMIYLTAGWLDIYENQDCDLESIITKCFSAEQTAAITSNIMQFCGSPAYTTDHWSNVLHRDALGYLLLNDSVDNMKIVIALQGLRHAGIELQDLIKKIRNPLFYTVEVFKRMWTERRHRSDYPYLPLQLSHYLHPSAISGAEWLEFSVMKLQYGTEMLLATYGQDVVNKHTDLKRLADTAIDIYAMVACLGRASRSYCIGLAHSDYEMLLANAFCQRAMNRVKERIRFLLDGPYINSDAANKKIGEKVFHVRRYFPEHPLTRNF